MDIIIRNEEENDFRSVEELTREAFWNLHYPGCDEHYLVHIMREHPDFIKEMDFVATLDDKIVGNIMYTRSYLINDNDERLETLTFGPLFVIPEYQRKGIGSALIQHTVQMARDRNIPALIIYGNPANYVKHAFKNGRDYSISTPEGKYPLGLLVLALDEAILGSQHWSFHCSEVYNLIPEEAEAFEQSFPEKEKGYRYSQEEFSMIVRAVLE